MGRHHQGRRRTAGVMIPHSLRWTRLRRSVGKGARLRAPCPPASREDGGQTRVTAASLRWWRAVARLGPPYVVLRCARDAWEIHFSNSPRLRRSGGVDRDPCGRRLRLVSPLANEGIERRGGAAGRTPPREVPAGTPDACEASAPSNVGRAPPRRSTAALCEPVDQPGRVCRPQPAKINQAYNASCVCCQ